MSSSITFDLTQFKRAIGEKREELNAAARAGAQAGAQVVYDRARANVRDSKKGHWFHGTSFKTSGTKYWFEPGTLRNSIYQVYSKDNSTASKATYHIAWNHKEAPYGFMVEIKRPFLGPAMKNGMEAALQAMRATYIQRVNDGNPAR